MEVKDEYKQVGLYSYKEKQVKIGSACYKAQFPKEHSAVDGIVWTSFDENQYDHRGGVPRIWQRVFYIKWKGSEEWELIPNDGSKGFRDLKQGAGIIAAFMACESDEWKAAKWAKERVRDLKDDIPDARKALKSMEREYLTLTGRSI